jgi:putative ABC transport system permease protein
VLLRSDYPKMQQQSVGDWVFWSDTQAVIKQSRTLESVGVYGNAIFDLAGDPGATPEALYGLQVTAGLFPTLGVTPMLGRNILPGEDRPGHPQEMILSYGLWARRFHSDPGVIGRTVTVNGHGCRIIGVMPPEFNFPLRRSAAHTPSPYVEFWSPLIMTSTRERGAVSAVARLRPGVSLAQARQDLAVIGEQLTRDYPATNRDRVLALNSLRDRTVGPAEKSLLLLMGGALLFMLIGCANVANLLLARGLARQPEIAIRLAIGATPLRIVRQLLTESCALALLGGIGGILITAASWSVLRTVAPVSIPRLSGTRADFGVLAFSLALAFVNGILFGIVPALRLATTPPKHDRLRPFLVMAEVAVSVILLILGGQLLGSFLELLSVDPGFQADRVLASVVLPAPERYPDPVHRAIFYKQILDAVRALPGVDYAGTADALPFSGENHGGTVTRPGAAPLLSEIDVVGGDYLQAMGIRLLSGRWFRDEEMNDANDSAIVNDRVAAVDQRICVDCTPENPNNWKRVVGVVSSATHAALDETPKGNVYLSAGAMKESAFVVVRTAHPTADLEKAIRRAIAAIDPNQPVFLSASMRSLIADSLADRRFIMMLLVITASLALLMSAAGVYGVVSYTTSRRTKEIGIRMAVGATPGNVSSLIFRQGFTTVAAGLAIGLCAALPLTHAGHRAWICLALTVVAATAALACWLPARRALFTDPVSALRHG